MLDSSGKATISRKQFIISGALGAVGLGFGKPLTAGESGGAETSGRARVVLVRDRAALSEPGQKDGAVLRSLLEKSLCAYTGESDPLAALGRFVKPGDTVGVKMNVMMTATHPELVAELVRLLVRAGVNEKKIIIWDRDNAGLGVEGAFARNLHYGYGAGSVSRIITDEADVLINFPALKSHWLSGLAGALKNWAGAVTGINVQDNGSPYPFHGDSCANLGMLNAIEPIRKKCRLVIIDALRPLFEGGPQVNPAYLWHYGGLFLGEDPVAVDTLLNVLLEKKREQFKGRPWPLTPPVKHLAVAESRYHLGISDPEKIDLLALGEESERLI
ncbi:MAG: hypothetical protein A3F83_06440 [Candidatus Glassbacteria bacterium RIFCSPLOWO2_12_FULL_58_11]|uniref:DUF362 domain-containing protein n=1 Tax=Candidatus Glassbacteria bacterium RIFCSPLOWO2_12_FULL_58_11 TaxID=1817867 RepID=A0A1F5YL86_9BACT|nr:MAG: hypothetical protein A3F83_06440 [Candidatus Glassbacteria bacterium RIFCSPLOWO2_12_FULL_58_11]